MLNDVTLLRCAVVLKRFTTKCKIRGAERRKAADKLAPLSGHCFLRPLRAGLARSGVAVARRDMRFTQGAVLHAGMGVMLVRRG